MNPCKYPVSFKSSFANCSIHHRPCLQQLLTVRFSWECFSNDLIPSFSISLTGIVVKDLPLPSPPSSSSFLDYVFIYIGWI